MYCANCGIENPEGSKFCRQCGREIIEDVQEVTIIENEPTEGICPSCGAENPLEAKFCHMCGQSLEMGTPKQEIVDTEIVAVPAAAGKVSDNAENTVDTICPFCGAAGCQMFMRDRTTVKQSAFSFTDACCGTMIFGPLGLLCGLCGGSQKVDIKNETWFACQKCGKQHISQQSAMNKTKALGLSAFGASLLGALFLSYALWFLNFTWISFFALAIPAGMWMSLFETTKSELGRSIIDIIPADDFKKYLIIIVVSVLAVFILGCPILNAIIGY